MGAGERVQELDVPRWPTTQSAEHLPANGVFYTVGDGEYLILEKRSEMTSQHAASIRYVNSLPGKGQANFMIWSTTAAT